MSEERDVTKEDLERTAQICAKHIAANEAAEKREAEEREAAAKKGA